MLSEASVRAAPRWRRRAANYSPPDFERNKHDCFFPSLPRPFGALDPASRRRVATKQQLIENLAEHGNFSGALPLDAAFAAALQNIKTVMIDFFLTKPYNALDRRTQARATRTSAVAVWHAEPTFQGESQ